MADVLMQRVGPVVSGDGALSPVRAARDGAQVVTGAHGPFYEAVARGNVWTIATPTAGIIVTANMLVSVASSNAIVGLYNPTPNFNLHVLRTVVVIGSNATATGVVWGTIGTTALISPLPAGVQRAKNALTFVIGGHRAKAFDGSVAVSGSGATDLYRHIVGIVINTPLSVQETDEDLIVGPGAFAGIYGDTVTTAAVVKASVSWEEVPV